MTLARKYLVLVYLVTDYNSKITEFERRVPSYTSLATTATLTAVYNKIPDVSNLVTKSRL